MSHPRQVIRERVKDLIEGLNLDVKEIMIGGSEVEEEKRLPSINVVSANEKMGVLVADYALASYTRAMLQMVVISVTNSKRIDAITQAENLARPIEVAMNKPDSSVLDSTILSIQYSDFNIMMPEQGSTVFKVQLLFTITYKDQFTRG